MAEEAVWDDAVWKAVDRSSIEALQAALAAKPHLIDTPCPGDLHGMNKGRTPMHLAAQRGRVDYIELLVRSGSRALDTPDKSGETPMHRAAWNNHWQAIEALVRLGSCCVDKPGEFNVYPIHSAAVNGGVESVETLIRLGSKAIDELAGGVQSPLSIAAGQPETLKLVDLLLHLGANRNIPEEDLDEKAGKLIKAPLNEDRAAATRFRIYFSRKLLGRLLFELEILENTAAHQAKE